MKHYLFSIALIACLLTSCTKKVIELDLNNATPKYVIESFIQSGVNDFKVRVTKSTDYFSPAVPVNVSNATVTLSSSNGTSSVLTYTEDGYYVLAAFEALAGVTYTLDLSADGNSFQGTIIMPGLVSIGSMEQQGNDVILKFQDPAAVENYYWIFYQVNTGGGEKQERIFYDDFAENGNLVEIGLFIREFDENDETFFVSGDTIHVELRSIAKETYQYFTTLEAIVYNDGSPFAAAPANPVTNWSNDALGYFGAGNSAFGSFIVP